MKNQQDEGRAQTAGVPRIKLGLHHMAYLRAITQGIDSVAAALRYLPIDHGHEAITAHREIASRVRAVAKRRGLKLWRLGGIHIPQVRSEAGDKPSFEAFIEMKGLEDWSMDEAQALYQEEYPENQDVARRALRSERLRKQQFEMYRIIESTSLDTAEMSDDLDSWMVDSTIPILKAYGLITLGDLVQKMQSSHQWNSDIPAIGPAKAKRIESFIKSLLPQVSLQPESEFHTTVLRVDANDQAHSVAATSALSLPELTTPGDLGKSHAVAQPSGADRSDEDIVAQWVKARAASPATAKSYTKEGRRLLLWLKLEKSNIPLCRVGSQECMDYMAFLQNIPDRWISRAYSKALEPGWAPFKGQLSHKSYQHTIVVVNSLFKWLLKEQLISRDPWNSVNLNSGDEKGRRPSGSKALTENTINEVVAFITRHDNTPSHSRMKFIVLFLEAVGLRSAELLSAKLGDFRLEEDAGWQLSVFGKGAKNRDVAIPQQAVAALNEYLLTRGLGVLGEAPGELPLLASTVNPTETIAYPTLYANVKNWFERALSEADLSKTERSKLEKASTHWLRHTFGTRAVAREVPMDVIQAQLGHASIETTMSIYGRSPARRMADEIGRAFK